jgi:hypothetical protein
MPKDGVATSQIVYRFVCKPVVSLSCGIEGLGAALVKIGKYRLARRGAMPRSKFIPVKIHSGLGEGVGHTSPSYMVDKVCPRLPVWKV